MKIILEVTNRNTESQTFRDGRSLIIHDIHLPASPRLFCVILGHVCFPCSSKINLIESTERNLNSELKYELDFKYGNCLVKIVLS